MVISFNEDASRLMRAVHRVLDECDTAPIVKLAVIAQAVGKLTYELGPTDDPERVPDILWKCILENMALGRVYAKGE